MCSESFHLLCLNPPLSRPPRGAWTCPDCKSDKDKGRSSSTTAAKKVAKQVAKRKRPSEDEESVDEEGERSDEESAAEDPKRNGNESGKCFSYLVLGETLLTY